MIGPLRELMDRTGRYDPSEIFRRSQGAARLSKSVGRGRSGVDRPWELLWTPKRSIFWPNAVIEWRSFIAPDLTHSFVTVDIRLPNCSKRRNCCLGDRQSGDDSRPFSLARGEGYLALFSGDRRRDDTPLGDRWRGECARAFGAVWLDCRW